MQTPATSNLLACSQGATWEAVGSMAGGRIKGSSGIIPCSRAPQCQIATRPTSQIAPDSAAQGPQARPQVSLSQHIMQPEMHTRLDRAKG